MTDPAVRASTDFAGGSHRSPDVRVVRLVALAAGCAAGAWCGLSSNWPAAPGFLVLTLLAAGILVAALIRERSRVAVGAVGWLAVGVLAAGADAAHHMAWLRQSPLTALSAARAVVTAHLRLVRDPVSITTAEGQRMWLVDATVLRVRQDAGPSLQVDRPVLVFGFSRAWNGLLPGQRVDVNGRLGAPRAGDTVSAVMDARSPPTPVGGPPWWQRAASRVRFGLARACAGLSPAARSLVPALVLGVVTPLPARLKEQFRVTGLSHLVAVSGENLGILFAAVVWLLRSMGLPRPVRVVALAATVAAFVVVARPSASVLRAAAMGAVAVLALVTGRRRRPLPALALAVIALLVADPVLVRDIGFQLSVAATAGIILLAPRIADRLGRRIPRRVAVLVAVPAAAQLACTPLLLAGFGQLTPYAIPANLAAGVAVPAATLTGVVAAVVALVLPPAGALTAHVAAVPAAWIVECARWFSRLPGAAAAAPGWTSLLALAGLALLSVRLARRRQPARSCHP